MDVGFAFLRSRLAAPAALALAALLLIGSSGAALAVKAGPDTVQCNGKCEACAEFEVAGDGTKRCVKCGVAPQCLGGNDPGLSSDFTEMVDRHNKYRGGQCGSLTWSQELATAAQAWASQCTKAHSPGAFDANSGYGESLAWGQSLSGTGAVDLWYAEVKSYKFQDPVWSKAVGHFTQLVWKGSKQIGCGVASCANENYWVCRYSPSGNFNVSTDFVSAADAKKNLIDNVGCAEAVAKNLGMVAGGGDGGGGGGGGAPAGGGGGAPAGGGGNAPAGKTATVNQDVDVYAAPGGNGDSIGVLRAPNTVTLLGACSDNWCNVAGPAVPTGKGWVYDAADFDSLAF